MPAERAPVLWDVVEEHLDEAEFLAAQWEAALASPLYPIAEVATGAEARLSANVEGLVVAGPAAQERLLAPALESLEPARVLAAALALLEAPGREGLELVLARLRVADADADGATPLVRALGLARRRGLAEELLPLARAEQGAAAGAVLEALAFRRMPVPDDLLAARIEAGEPDVLPAALRAARASPRLWPFVERHLEAPAPAARDAAVATGLALGARAAYLACRRQVEELAPGCDVALRVLGMSGDPSDVDRIVGALAVEELRRPALHALGLTGRAAAVDTCLPFLADEALGPVAAEAVSAVTGLVIAGEFEQPEAPEEEATDEALEEPAPEDDLDADLELTPESELPRPAAAVVEAWWRGARDRFDPSRRFLDGAPWDPDRLLAAFLEGSTRRRRALGLELLLRSRGAYAVETGAWATDQLRVQAGLRLVVRSEFTSPLERLLRE